MWKGTNEDMLSIVELINKDNVVNKEDQLLEMEEVIADEKASAAVAIFHAKIHLTEDM